VWAGFITIGSQARAVRRLAEERRISSFSESIQYTGKPYLCKEGWRLAPHQVKSTHISVNRHFLASAKKATNFLFLSNKDKCYTISQVIMTTMTISLPDSLKDFIEREVQTKGYGNISEYVRGLLREAQQKEADARLEALLLEGLSSDKDSSNNREFWREIKAEAAQIAARKKQRSKRRPG
jgi:antitoxin ParD1/3/4